MSEHDRISRRDLLKMAGVVAGGAILHGCMPGVAGTPTRLLSPTALPTALPTAWPSLPTGLPSLPTSSVSYPRAQVGIAKAGSYDPALIKKQLQDLFDGLGGLRDVIGSGDKVAIKVNLTGGVKGNVPPPGTTPTESWVTHPAVVQAMGELLRDSGASKIYIVESVWEWQSYTAWGYEEMAKGLGATLLDLNHPDPYTDYATLPVGKDSFIYERFKLNHVLEEVDALVSVAKMKCHYLLGITQSMKNLVGLAPYHFYERTAGDGYRTGFHGAATETQTRLPRGVMDLNRARKVNLSLIDGIKTVEGSEGPWNHDLTAVSPGVLIGGKNPVSTDAVAGAAMGFDPTAEYPDSPFFRAQNHLNIAHRLGLGSNRLTDVDTRGVSLDEVRMQFQPAR